MYRTACERIWREPVVRTTCEQILVPDRYEYRDRTCYDGGYGSRPYIRRERVLVCPAHYEKIERQVVVCDGHYETIEHQVLVREGGYHRVERQELVTPGHYENRTDRVEVVAGHWENGGGFDLRIER